MGVDTAEIEVKTVCGDTSLPIGPRDEAWDGAAAKKQIFDYAAKEDGTIDPAKARKCFLQVDGDTSLKGSYHYPFCTIEPNVGIVEVPDSRLAELAEIVKPQKVQSAVVEFVDIAGLVKGAASGEGLGNQFLSHIRDVDAILHVVRCFDDTNVIHVDGSVNPKRDIEIIDSELILKDLETVEKKIDGAARKAKTGDAKAKAEVDLYERVKDHLGAGKLARTFAVSNDDETIWMRDMHLITRKPVMYIANTDEAASAGNALCGISQPASRHAASAQWSH